MKDTDNWPVVSVVDVEREKEESEQATRNGNGDDKTKGGVADRDKWLTISETILWYYSICKN